MRATSSGCRYGSTMTVVPSRTRVVMPASQDSVVKGSKNRSGYRTATSGVTTTWSDTMRRLKPSPSTIRPHSRSTPGSVPGP